ncbi:MAG: DUF6512 family protein, partial [Gammaproteobacteria bacterium]
GVLFIILAGGPLHELFRQSGFWPPVALIAAVNASIWEHQKMQFWPGLVFACFQWFRIGKRIPNYWFGKLVGLVVTPVLASLSYVVYMIYERAAAEFSPSLVITMGSTMLSVCIGQAICYKVLTADSVPASFSRFTKAGYVLMLAAFSLFTYFPPRLGLFEHNRHYQPVGEYGIDVVYENEPHPWEVDEPHDE